MTVIILKILPQIFLSQNLAQKCFVSKNVAQNCFCLKISDCSQNDLSQNPFHFNDQQTNGSYFASGPVLFKLIFHFITQILKHL